MWRSLSPASQEAVTGLRFTCAVQTLLAPADPQAFPSELRALPQTKGDRAEEAVGDGQGTQ